MITTLSGKNSFALDAELLRIISDAKHKFGDMGVERFNASETEVDTLLQAVQSLPFLAPKKLVVIDEAQSNSAFMERIEEVIDRTPDDVDVALVGPVFDKRKSSYNMLKKLTKVQEFNELVAHQLPSWLVAQAKDNGAQLSNSDAAYMVDRVGDNQLILASEIEKMSLFSSNITREIIDKLTDRSAQRTIFELLDSAFAGDNKKALRLYREQRSNKVEPQYIIAMLTWQLQLLAQAVFAEPQNESTLVSAGQSSFTARKALNLARNVSKVDVRRMVAELSNLDKQIKTSADPDAALELYLLSLGK